MNTPAATRDSQPRVTSETQPCVTSGSHATVADDGQPTAAGDSQHLVIGSGQHRGDQRADLLVSAGLTILARADWAGENGAEPPGIAGFVMSSFSPLAAVVAEECLRSYFGSRPAEPGRGERTAIVLASATGDIGTAAAVSDAVDAGRRVPPLLFYQANPNAVAGYIAARWGLAGPVACTIPAGDALTDALASATMLIEDGDADAALVIVANQGTIGTGHRSPDYGTADVRTQTADNGTALMIGPLSWLPATCPAEPGDASRCGLGGFLR